ncbi:DNA polymerase IV, partial [archaeon]
MVGVDKAHVARIVEEASKGSKYYENAQAREAALMLRIQKLKEQVARVSAFDMKAMDAAMTSYFTEVEAQQVINRVWVVVDMDQFFAAVAMRDDPTLRDIPFAVGGLGMISTASYAARKYGVRSAMPGFIALKLCPQLKFVPCDFDKYKAASLQAQAVFRTYDPHCAAMSLDEAFLDITDYCARTFAEERQGERAPTAVPGQPARDLSEASGDASCSEQRAARSSASDSDSESESDDDARRVGGWGACIDAQKQAHIERVVQQMREEVCRATGGLTCSAGIAMNGLVAKIASNDNKPNGQKCVPFTLVAVREYMASQPVRALPGVGKVTEKTLVELGLHTCG